MNKNSENENKLIFLEETKKRKIIFMYLFHFKWDFNIYNFNLLNIYLYIKKCYSWTQFIL